MDMQHTPAGKLDRPAELLYFEDNETDSLLVQSQFEKESVLPAKFTIVERLGDGLSLLQTRQFDLALLDLNLPDSQGLPSLDALRHAAPALPVVVISGLVDDRMALELLTHGAQDCLSKSPALASQIANAVRFAMHRQQTAIELGLRVREAEAAKAHARTILDASLDAVVVFDIKGLVRYVNPAAEVMFSRKASEMLGQSLGLPLDIREPSEIDIVRRNGERGSAEIRVVEIEWEGGRANLVMLRDNTERKKMEAALLHGEKLQALGTLAGGIAHDFNNILLSVSGNAKLALEQLDPGNPAHTHVLEIAKAGSRATALTKKILSFSRQQDTNRHPTQIQAVVEEALSLIRPTLPIGVEIQRDFPLHIPPIFADASQIHQVLANLASNAADAIGEGTGRLEFSACQVHLNGNGSGLSSKLKPGDYVKLSVKDTGTGIDKQTMTHVFEPFFTTKPQGRGTGMGLAIVHGVMKNHLGEVTVYSEVGKGTVFNLYFPVAHGAVAELPATIPAPAGQGQHILYVDDEEPLVLLVTRTLERLGYRVSGFTNPVEAIRILRANPCDFHAIVTDLSMPQMSGTDLANEAMQICPRVPIILTTGYIRPQDQELAQHIGVRELILKPDTVEELGTVLHRLLNESPLTQSAASGQN
jgi:signal transduction histidine kinase